MISTNTQASVWKHKNTFAIGGLENVGFAEGQDLLLVLSGQGEGIFDCIKGERLARLNNDSDWWSDFNKETNSIKGFDTLDGIEIKTCGLYGEDHLKKSTKDEWTLLASEPEPDDAPFEQYLVKRIYLVSPDKMEKTFVRKLLVNFEYLVFLQLENLLLLPPVVSW